MNIEKAGLKIVYYQADGQLAPPSPVLAPLDQERHHQAVMHNAGPPLLLLPDQDPVYIHRMIPHHFHTSGSPSSQSELAQLLDLAPAQNPEAQAPESFYHCFQCLPQSSSPSAILPTIQLQWKLSNYVHTRGCDASYFVPPYEHPGAVLHPGYPPFVHPDPRVSEPNPTSVARPPHPPKFTDESQIDPALRSPLADSCEANVKFEPGPSMHDLRSIFQSAETEGKENTNLSIS